MANTIREKELKTKWPVVTGIEADSKHEGRQINLVPAQGRYHTRYDRGKGIDA